MRQWLNCETKRHGVVVIMTGTLSAFPSVPWEKYRGSIPAGHNCFNSSPAIILSAVCDWRIWEDTEKCNKQSVFLVAQNSTAHKFHQTYKTERDRRDFSLLHRDQIRPKAHPDSYKMENKCSFPQEGSRSMELFIANSVKLISMSLYILHFSPPELHHLWSTLCHVVIWRSYGRNHEVCFQLACEAVESERSSATFCRIAVPPSSW
jgi:hypothetical protein